MSKRICIVIDDEVDRKLRLIQAKEIQRTKSAVSYSGTVNQILKNSTKKIISN